LAIGFINAQSVRHKLNGPTCVHLRNGVKVGIQVQTES